MKTDTCLPTPEMIRHLNLDVIVTSAGQCISSKTTNKTMLDELIDRGYIESYHAEYGLMFATLRQAWLGKLVTQTAMLSDEILRQCPQVSASDLYDDVYRILSPMHANIIFWAVESPFETITAMVGDVCRHSFELLADAFADTYKILADKKESV